MSIGPSPDAEREDEEVIEDDDEDQDDPDNPDDVPPDPDDDPDEEDEDDDEQPPQRRRPRPPAPELEERAPAEAPPGAPPTRQTGRKKRTPEDEETSRAKERAMFEGLDHYEGDADRAVHYADKTYGLKILWKQRGIYKVRWEQARAKERQKEADKPSAPIQRAQETVEQRKLDYMALASMPKSARYFMAAETFEKEGNQRAAAAMFDAAQKSLDAETAPPAAPAPPAVPKYMDDLMKAVIEDKVKGGGDNAEKQMDRFLGFLERTVEVRDKLGGNQPEDRDVAMARVITGSVDKNFGKLTDTIKDATSRKPLKRGDDQEIVVECPKCRTRVRGTRASPPTHCPKCKTEFEAIQESDGTVTPTHRALPPPRPQPRTAAPAPAPATETYVAPEPKLEEKYDLPDCFAGPPVNSDIGYDAEDQVCATCPVKVACEQAVIAHGGPTPPEEDEQVLPDEAFEAWDRMHRIGEWVYEDTMEELTKRVEFAYGLGVRRAKWEHGPEGEPPKLLEAAHVKRSNAEAFNFALYISEIPLDQLIGLARQLAQHEEIAEFTHDHFTREDGQPESPQDLIAILAAPENAPKLEHVRRQFLELAKEDSLALSPEARAAITERLDGIAGALKPKEKGARAPPSPKAAAQPPVQVQVPKTRTQAAGAKLVPCPGCLQEGKPRDIPFPEGAMIPEGEMWIVKNPQAKDPKDKYALNRDGHFWRMHGPPVPGNV